MMKLLLANQYALEMPRLRDILSLGYDVLPLTDERAAVDGAADIEVAVCNGLFQHHELEAFPRLRFIQLTSAGLDRVPVAQVRERGIALANARGVYSIPIAEWVVLKILEICKHTRFFVERQQQASWEKRRDLLEVCGKTVGIVGCGSIGQEIAHRLSAFSATVLAFDLYDPACDAVHAFYHIDRLPEMVGTCDILVLALPLTERTRHLANADLFAHMRDGAMLINVSRGEIIHEADLLASLEQGKFHGVALDVFTQEPLPPESPLWRHPAVLVTPHNSFASDNINARLFVLITENLRRFAGNDRLINLV